MEKSFARFIQEIHNYTDYIQESQLLGFLQDSDVKLLKDLVLLKRGSDLKEIPCPSCDDAHFVEVRVEDRRLYCICPTDTARNYLDPKEVETWHFDVEAFLQKAALKLGISDNVEKLNVKDAWQIGGFSKDDTRHNCYYYQGRNLNEALDYIKAQPSPMRRYVLFTSAHDAVPPPLTDHSLLTIEMKDIADLKKRQLVFNKKLFKELLINGFRAVIFHKNGDLVVNGKRIVTITPTSPEYYFTVLLWKNFNEPVADKKIANFIYEKAKKDYADTAEKLCNKLKGKIKKASNEPKLIDEIFAPTNDLNGENAYIMGNPA